jgi:hypothetical protein
MKEREKRSAPAREPHDAPSGSSQADVDAPQIDEPAAQEQIRLRAYELYCERGGRAGDDVADWLQAGRNWTRGQSATDRRDRGDRGDGVADERPVEVGRPRRALLPLARRARVLGVHVETVAAPIDL